MQIKKYFSQKSRIFNVLVVSAGLVCLWLFRTEVGELAGMIGDREAIVACLEQYGGWGPLVLSIILGLQVFLAVVPGHAFMVAGGYVYGFFVGALITQAATVIASQLAYLLARKAGRPFVNRMAPANVIDKWNRLAEKQGVLFYFFSFILPIFPSDLMCFIAGLSSISPRKFFVANFLGRLPCAIFITLIGSHGFELPITFWAVFVLIIVVLCLTWKQIAAKLEDRFIASPEPIRF